jgi:hypothetical protein
MNCPKEPEPGPDGRAGFARWGRETGRILRLASREGEGYARGVKAEEFIGG